MHPFGGKFWYKITFRPSDIHMTHLTRAIRHGDLESASKQLPRSSLVGICGN